MPNSTAVWRCHRGCGERKCRHCWILQVYSHSFLPPDSCLFSEQTSDGRVFGIFSSIETRIMLGVLCYGMGGWIKECHQKQFFGFWFLFFFLQSRWSRFLKAPVQVLGSLEKKGKQALWWSACRNASTKPPRYIIGYVCHEVGKKMPTVAQNNLFILHYKWVYWWIDRSQAFSKEIIRKSLSGIRSHLKLYNLFIKLLLGAQWGNNTQAPSYFVGKISLKLRIQILRIIISKEWVKYVSVGIGS